MALRKVWETFRGVDRRALQYEIDMHRLFLLTSYCKLGDGSLDDVTEAGSKASVEDLQKIVNGNVHEQIVRITEVMDDILLVTSRRKLPSTENEVKKRPSGLSFAVGREVLPKVEDPETLIPLKTHSLSFAEVSSRLKELIGYTLSLMPSQIDHKEAGQGVHLKGKVGPGTVVSFYPGIIYSPSQYRYMRGYPRMDVMNSYLVSRYDGLIIDGQFWGQGGDSRLLWNGRPTKDASENTEPNKMNLWSSVFGAKDSHYARKASIIERRNPLALAHYINHPAKGSQPNVMLCPYDFVLSDPYTRPYIPNVHFDHNDDHEMKRQGVVWTYNRKGEKTCTGSVIIRTLVLVSTAEIQNEELFLNYRLSNHKKWPSWYHPVDSEEDKRRWY